MTKSQNKKRQRNAAKNKPKTTPTISTLKAGLKEPVFYDIKIGETTFNLSPESLKRDAPNFFTAAFFGYFAESRTTSIFIERDPTFFAMIVRYLRGYQVDWPIHDRTAILNLLDDVKFYGFERLQQMLEEMYEREFPAKVIPWQVRKYAPEDDPVVAVNIKDIELDRWDSSAVSYDTNAVPLKTQLQQQQHQQQQQQQQQQQRQRHSNDDDNSDENAGIDVNNNDNANVNENVNDTNDNANINDTNAADNNANAGNDNDLMTSTTSTTPLTADPTKGLYRLEIHGRDALATVTSSQNNGIKFETFCFTDPDVEATFRAVTAPLRATDGSLTLTPSLKLRFLNHTCVEIDGSRYFNHNDLSSYLGVTSRGTKLFIEEAVLRIDGGIALLIRVRAWTYPSYYAKQPFLSSRSSDDGVSQ